MLGFDGGLQNGVWTVENVSFQGRDLGGPWVMSGRPLQPWAPMHYNTPKPPKKKKVATKRKGQTIGEGGGKATKGVVEKKEKEVAAKGAGEGQPKRCEGK